VGNGAVIGTGNDYYAKSPKANPHGPGAGDGRVFRGGSWCYEAGLLRVALRDWAPSGEPDFNLGFRVLRPQSSEQVK